MRTKKRVKKALPRTTTIRVNVTQKTIDRAAGIWGDQCPIFCALRKRVKGDLIVGVTSASLGDIGVPLPEVAEKFSRSHFWGSEVSPISFSLKVPAQLVKRAARKLGVKVK